jgi:pilus assembly protein CpaB
MKKNLMPLLGVAFVAAVIATGIFYGLLIGRLRTGQSSGGTGRALVASRALDRGTVLKAEDLKMADWPKGTSPQGALTDSEQAAGLVLLDPLDAGQPLLARSISPRGAAGGASLAIPTGMRAVSIHPADSGGVVMMLRSGSRIDIQVLDAHGPGGVALRKLMQNVEVLSIGGAEGGGGRPVVTLLVSPDDADRLTLADAAMQIRLVLRNPSDKDTQKREPLTPDALRRSAPVASAALIR